MRDVTELLDPIPGDNPAGPHLRYDPLYDALQELRREDDASTPRGIWQSKIKAADWSQLIDTASKALISRTKDLQIAVWLVEGLVARDGLPGLVQGFDALSVLVDNFWPSLWPALGEDGDLDTRLAPLEWLNAKLPTRVALVEIAESDAAPTWHQYLSIQRAMTIPATGKGEKPAKTMETLMQTVDQTASDFYRQRAFELSAVDQSLTRLKRNLQNQCGSAAPSFAKLEQSLAGLRGFIRAELVKRGIPFDDMQASDSETDYQPEEMTMSDDSIEQVAAESAGDDSHEDHGAPAQAPAASQSGPLMLRDRAHAYRVLTQVAQFLQRTEPHSPVPHLVLRAVSWGSMTLPDLLDELLREDTGSLYRLLGLHQGGGDGMGGGGGKPGARKARIQE